MCCLFGRHLLSDYLMSLPALSYCYGKGSVSKLRGCSKDHLHQVRLLLLRKPLVFASQISMAAGSEVGHALRII